MTDELRSYLVSSMAQDDNIQAVGIGAGGKTVIYVLDDAPEMTAPYIARAQRVRR